MSPTRRTPSRRPAVLGTFLLPAVLILASASCNDSSSPSGAGPIEARTQRSLRPASESARPVEIEVFAPEEGDKAGLEGNGWFIDIAVVFPPISVRATGFAGNQLTGPGGHNNIPPFSGNWAPGKDDKFPGLVVLVSTATFGAKGCQNVAGLFNLTGVTNKAEDETEIWDTYIVGGQAYGRGINTIVYLAEVKDLNKDGIYNDAPDVVPDVNHDGRCDAKDLEALGLDSEVTAIPFFIN